MNFAKIAPYLTNPLVLIGFILLLFFCIHHSLLKSGIISRLSKNASNKVVKSVLRYGFVIAVLVIVLGFTLEGWKHSLSGSVNFITIEEYEKRLRAHEAELSARLETLAADETKERKRLENELALTRDKLKNIQIEYDQLKLRLGDAARTMAELENEFPEQPLADARNAIMAGRFKEAEVRLGELFAFFRGRTVQLARQLSLLAETRNDWSAAEGLAAKAEGFESERFASDAPKTVLVKASPVSAIVVEQLTDKRFPNIEQVYILKTSERRDWAGLSPVNQTKEIGKRLIVGTGKYDVAYKPLGNQSGKATILLAGLLLEPYSTATLLTDDLISAITVQARKGIIPKRFYVIPSGGRRDKAFVVTGGFEQACDAYGKVMMVTSGKRYDVLMDVGEESQFIPIAESVMAQPGQLIVVGD